MLVQVCENVDVGRRVDLGSEHVAAKQQVWSVGTKLASSAPKLLTKRSSGIRRHWPDFN